MDFVSSSKDTVVLGSTEYPIEISSGNSQAISSAGSQEEMHLQLLFSPEF